MELLAISLMPFDNTDPVVTSFSYIKCECLNLFIFIKVILMI